MDIILIVLLVLILCGGGYGVWGGTFGANAPYNIVGLLLLVFLLLVLFGLFNPWGHFTRTG
jgi:uncharacterized membrane protein (DUF373 family)